jgi:hypothetical protein
LNTQKDKYIEDKNYWDNKKNDRQRKMEEENNKYYERMDDKKKKIKEYEQTYIILFNILE